MAWGENLLCGKLFWKIIWVSLLISFLLSLKCLYKSSRSLMGISFALKRSQVSTFFANHRTCKRFKISSETNLGISIMENKVNIYKKNKCLWQKKKKKASLKKTAQEFLHSAKRVEATGKWKLNSRVERTLITCLQPSPPRNGVNRGPIDYQR